MPASPPSPRSVLWTKLSRCDSNAAMPYSSWSRPLVRATSIPSIRRPRMPLAWPTVVRSPTLTGPSGADQHRPAPAQGSCSPGAGGSAGALMIARPFPTPLTLIALSPKFTASTYTPRRSRGVSPDSARSAASLMVRSPD